MKTNLKYILGMFVAAVAFNSCDKDNNYSLGALVAPSDLVITTSLVGQDATHPNGDGSGNVIITVTAPNALSYKVDYDANDAVNLVALNNGTVNYKYTKLGVNTYRITAIAYGTGGSSSTITKDVTVRSDFTVAPAIVTNLTGGTTKTWVVDQSVPGHFGVGSWTGTNYSPEWWSAAINEKVNCCNCFYTANYIFAKTPAGGYTVQVTTTGQIFANADNDNLGIAGAGEGCYNYGGATHAFTFGPSTTSTTAANSTLTNINVVGIDGFIAYGSCSNVYEILSLTPTTMYLRSQGTNTGNAWYIKMKSI